MKQYIVIGCGRFGSSLATTMSLLGHQVMAIDKSEELIQKTGGIVQGMSGSPIIQNGKIIGAVTHVIVDNPTTGYGILITKMLEEGER